MPSIIKILSHLRLIGAILNDVEDVIGDLVHHKPISADGEKALKDLCELLASGLIIIPGVSQDDINKLVGGAIIGLQPLPEKVVAINPETGDPIA